MCEVSNANPPAELEVVVDQIVDPGRIEHGRHLITDSSLQPSAPTTW